MKVEPAAIEDNLPSLSHIYRVQGILVLICCGALFFLARPTLGAFISGALLITFNFMLLVGLWRGILDKKPIARTTLIVVIKYAILAIVIYIFVRQFRYSLLPLIAGLSTLLGTFIIVALETYFLNRSK